MNDATIDESADVLLNGGRVRDGALADVEREAMEKQIAMRDELITAHEKTIELQHAIIGDLKRTVTMFRDGLSTLPMSWQVPDHPGQRRERLQRHHDRCRPRRQAAEAAAKRAKAAAAAEAAATATREAEAFTNQIITAMTPILPIGAVKRLVDQIAQRERITIYWLSDDHRQQSASASPAGRYVRLHPIRTMADCACALHEIGHVVNGVCPGTGRHLRDVRVTTSFACLECERRSWEIGLQLFPFSAPMYQELSRTLRTYARQHPGPAGHRTVSGTTVVVDHGLVQRTATPIALAAAVRQATACHAGTRKDVTDEIRNGRRRRSAARSAAEAIRRPGRTRRLRTMRCAQCHAPAGHGRPA